MSWYKGERENETRSKGTKGGGDSQIELSVIGKRRHCASFRKILWPIRPCCWFSESIIPLIQISSSRYSKFVRTITVTPKPVVPEILDETSYFSFQPKIRIKPLTNTQLLDFVSTLEGLEAFIWWVLSPLTKILLPPFTHPFIPLNPFWV